jgi:hypothetical protein
LNVSSAGAQTGRNREAITDARTCDVARKPDAFNHKRIRLTGIVTQEFEHFAIADPFCADAQDAAQIWLTFGGRISAGVMYCCPGKVTEGGGRVT